MAALQVNSNILRHNCKGKYVLTCNALKNKIIESGIRVDPDLYHNPHRYDLFRFKCIGRVSCTSKIFMVILVKPRPEVIKLFPCLTQLSMKF